MRPFASLPVIPFALGVAFGVIALAAMLTPVLRTASQPRVDGVTYAPSTWKSHTDQILLQDTFVLWSSTISYPRDFTVREGASGTSILSTRPTEFALPDDAFDGDGTNFAGASVTMDYNEHTSEAACMAVPNADGTTIVGGRTFVVGAQAEAAAGNLYNSTIYRSMIDGVCTEITTTLHTTNVGNYEPGTITEFDSEQTDVIFAEILRTISFKNAPAED